MKMTLTVRKCSPGRTGLLLTAILLSWMAHAMAAPSQVLPFGAGTWRELAAARQPQVVVFTTTDCAHCPKVIDGLADAIRRHRTTAWLAIVVMDGAGREEALRRDDHYRRAHRLYAFEGDATMLRYSVNPRWRGLTPYVAFVSPDGTTRFHNGAPPAADLVQYLKQR